MSYQLKGARKVWAMKRLYVAALLGMFGFVEPVSAAVNGFHVIRCQGVFVDTGARASISNLYRIGFNESQVWDPSARLWRRSGCAAQGACSFGRQKVFVKDSFITQGRLEMDHQLIYDRRTKKLREFWHYADGSMSYRANCKAANDPLPTDHGVAPSERTDVHTLSRYSITSGYPFPLARSKFEYRFSARDEPAEFRRDK